LRRGAPKFLTGGKEFRHPPRGRSGAAAAWPSGLTRPDNPTDGARVMVNPHLAAPLQPRAGPAPPTTSASVASRPLTPELLELAWPRPFVEKAFLSQGRCNRLIVPLEDVTGSPAATTRFAATKGPGQPLVLASRTGGGWRRRADPRPRCWRSGATLKARPPRSATRFPPVSGWALDTAQPVQGGLPRRPTAACT